MQPVRRSCRHTCIKGAWATHNSIQFKGALLAWKFPKQGCQSIKINYNHTIHYLHKYSIFYVGLSLGMEEGVQWWWMNPQFTVMSLILCSNRVIHSVTISTITFQQITSPCVCVCLHECIRVLCVSRSFTVPQVVACLLLLGIFLVLSGH